MAFHPGGFQVASRRWAQDCTWPRYSCRGWDISSMRLGGYAGSALPPLLRRPSLRACRAQRRPQWRRCCPHLLSCRECPPLCTLYALSRPPWYSGTIPLHSIALACSRWLSTNQTLDPICSLYAPSSCPLWWRSLSELELNLGGRCPGRSAEWQPLLHKYLLITR